eukprot:sb/3478224/
MYDKDNSYIGGVTVLYPSPVRYSIHSCMISYIDLPVQPPVEVDKIWTITKINTALIITCNGVEVLNYVFADSSNSDCVSRWGGSDVEQIFFYKRNSYFYRAG